MTPAERQILANQHEILAHLKPDDAKWHRQAEEVFRNGYSRMYSVYDRIYEPLSDDRQRHVLDTLSMFEALNDVVERRGIPQGIEEHEVRFAGFDGNNEASEMSFARWFCDELGRFENLPKPHDFNSHHPTFDRYARMVDAWKDEGCAGGGMDGLTDEGAIRVVEAGRLNR